MSFGTMCSQRMGGSGKAGSGGAHAAAPRLSTGMDLNAVDELRHEYRRFASNHPGHPLGPGSPLGHSLRLDGESHLQAWKRILRSDPCAYCGAHEMGSIDHIEPQNPLVPYRGLGDKWSHPNLIGSCQSCNESKRDKSLLTFLRLRRR